MNCDVAPVLAGLDTLVRAARPEGAQWHEQFAAWRDELGKKRTEFPMTHPGMRPASSAGTAQDGAAGYHGAFTEDTIHPQHAIQVLQELTGGDAIVSTGVGQHQMWAAQWYHFRKPRRFLTSGGLGSMGFGLPAAVGAAAANPDATVVCVDGDGSFTMNIQELATCRAEGLNVKIMILNNQHLGMVVQWEDKFYKQNRAHTYLGLPSPRDYAQTCDEVDIYPDFLPIATGFGAGARRVTRVGELRGAIEEMLRHDGPFVLDVMVPHQDHVLPMIPGGGTFKDIITE